MKWTYNNNLSATTQCNRRKLSHITIPANHPRIGARDSAAKRPKNRAGIAHIASRSETGRTPASPATKPAAEQSQDRRDVETARVAATGIQGTDQTAKEYPRVGQCPNGY